MVCTHHGDELVKEVERVQRLNHLMKRDDATDGSNGYIMGPATATVAEPVQQFPQMLGLHDERGVDLRIVVMDARMVCDIRHVHMPFLVWCSFGLSSRVVWCVVVWCGVVWCGVVWCGVVRCGLLCCVVLCCAVLWCVVLWCGVVCCGVVCWVLCCVLVLLC